MDLSQMSTLKKFGLIFGISSVLALIIFSPLREKKMKNLVIAAMGAFAYEYLKSKGYIKGFKIDNRPVAEQAIEVVSKPTSVFLPQSEQ